MTIVEFLGGQTDDLDIINNEQRVDRCTFTSQLSEIHYRTKFNTKTFVMPDIFQTEHNDLLSQLGLKKSISQKSNFFKILTIFEN